MKRLMSFASLPLFSLLSTLVFSLVFFNLSNNGTAAPKVSHVNTLAFTAMSRDPKFGQNIYTIQTDGSNRRQITQNTQNMDLIWKLVWSNNGKRLAFFSSETDLDTINADGTQLTKIFTDSNCKAARFNIKWLLKEQKLAFIRGCDGGASDTPGNTSLYVSDTTGVKGTKLIQKWEAGGIPPKTEISSSLYFSPNGQKVIFFKNKSIFEMSIDGSNLTKLTDAPGDGYPYHVVWSPDGTQIAFSYGENLYSHNLYIYLLNIKNKRLNKLSNKPLKRAYSDNIISWSPDGTKLAYYFDHGSEKAGTKLDIFVLDIGKKTVEKLTDTPGEYSDLQWSPNNQQIAFLSGDYSQRKLYTINVDKLSLTDLTSKLPPSEIETFMWSLNGQKMAFVKGEKTNERSEYHSILYVIDCDGNNLKELSNSDDSLIGDIAWQP